MSYLNNTSELIFNKIQVTSWNEHEKIEDMIALQQ